MNNLIVGKSFVALARGGLPLDTKLSPAAEQPDRAARQVSFMERHEALSDHSRKNHVKRFMPVDP